jgi:hypothetical protein
MPFRRGKMLIHTLLRVGAWPGANLPDGQAGGRYKVIFLAQTDAIIGSLSFVPFHFQSVPL